MCETDGQGGCTDWIVGDFNLYEKTAAEIESSSTRFLVDQNNVLVEVGLLATFGLRVGDRLITVGKSNMANPKGRKRILEWNFDAPMLKVVFMRKDDFHARTMENPKGKI